MTFTSFQTFGTTLEESVCIVKNDGDWFCQNKSKLSQNSVWDFVGTCCFVGLKRTEFVTNFIELNNRDGVS
jgi:hypothetical protein